MPRIEVRNGDDKVYPFEVFEGDKRLDAFRSYFEASYYASQIRDWWKRK